MAKKFKDLLNEYNQKQADSVNDRFQKAQMLFFGNQAKKDTDKAISIIKDIGPDYPLAYTFLGVEYLYGEHINQDTDLGLYYLDLATFYEDKDALLIISDIYLNKKFNTNDFEKGLNYLHEGTLLGYHEAMVMLGIYHFDFPEEKHSFSIAYDLFVHADRMGNPDASAYIGMMYEYGDYVDLDAKKALQHYMKSASLNSKIGHYYLASMFLKGKVVNQNYKEAVSHLFVSAKIGFIPAIIDLLELYYEDPALINDMTAKELTDHLLELENPYGYYYYGIALLEGNLYPKNIKQGLQNLKLSDTGESNYLLGTFYAEGTYVDEDIMKALSYFTNSISFGYEEGIEAQKQILIELGLDEDI